MQLKVLSVPACPGQLMIPRLSAMLGGQHAHIGTRKHTRRMHAACVYMHAHAYSGHCFIINIDRSIAHHFDDGLRAELLGLGGRLATAVAPRELHQPAHEVVAHVAAYTEREVHSISNGH